jgi:hypothetical protein
VFSETAFQRARRKFGHEKVTNKIIDRIMEECSASSSSSTDIVMESSLLMSAVTDESIHLDGLYILVRRDPTAALLRLQQQ